MTGQFEHKISGEEDAAESERSDIIGSFGIGSFHFQLMKGRVLSRNTLNQYAELVEAFLKSYTNIDKIDVSGIKLASGMRTPQSSMIRTFVHSSADDENQKAKESVLGDKSDITSEEYHAGIHPWLVDGSIEFELSIPRRVQRDILQLWSET